MATAKQIGWWFKPKRLKAIALVIGAIATLIGTLTGLIAVL